jgi:ABC-type multidrug transport system fused ATPase/permease subunit
MVAAVLVTAILEMITVGSIIPFLNFLLGEQTQFREFSSIGNNLVIMLIIFFSIFGITTISRLFLLRYSIRTTYSIGGYLNQQLYRNILNQPYDYHIYNSSSRIVSLLSNKTITVVNTYLMAVITVFTSIVMLTAVLIIILFYSSPAVLFVTVFFGIIYVVINFYYKRKLLMNSELFSTYHPSLIAVMQETSGGIRDIIINNNQRYFEEIYESIDKSVREAQISTSFITLSPKIYIEFFGVLAVLVSAILISESHSSKTGFITALAIFIYGTQKILPLLQQIYSSIANIKASSFQMSEVIEGLHLRKSRQDLNLPVRYCNFSNELVIKNLSFSYLSGFNVLDNLKFRVSVGDRIGVIGATGSGKTTFLDVLMGLLTANSCEIYVDGEKIEEGKLRFTDDFLAHVCQNIFLLDKTVIENVAFGIPYRKIDTSKVIFALKTACIYEEVAAMTNGLNTVVGERAINLSGGQRQRIALARALYKEPKFLVMDEATSALDDLTEQRILEALRLNYPNMTIVMVTHRKSMLNHCNRVVEMKNGRFLEECFD